MADKKHRSRGAERSRKGKNTSASKKTDIKRQNSNGGTRQGKNRRKRAMPLKRKLLLGVCIVFLIVVCAAMGVVAYVADKMGKIETETLDPAKLSISDEYEYDETGYLNVALFGLDTRATDESMGSRSDTIIVASLNRETKEIKMISVYRDTLMRLNDGEYYKATEAYAYGKEEEAIAMLNRNLDLSIDHYVTVDFNALVDVIDAVGGIEIDVTEEEVEGRDGFNFNGYIMDVMENTGKESVGVTEPGLQTLNGIQATAYARIRYTDGGDFARAERQRTVIEKTVEKLQNCSLSTLDQIIDDVFPKVKTNFTMIEILAYAKDVKKYTLGESQGFPFNKTTMWYGPQNCVTSTSMLDDIIELHKLFYGEDGYTPTSTVREICQELEYISSTSDSSGGGTDTYEYDSYEDSSTWYDNTGGSDDYSNYSGYDNTTWDDGSGGYDDTGESGDGTGDYNNNTGGNDEWNQGSGEDSGGGSGGESNGW